MVVRLRDGETGFLEKFARACGASEQDSGRIRATVSDILAQVREKGDRALLELTRKFDRLSLDTASLRFSPERIGKALTATDPGILEALRLARDRIWSHHARQKPNDHIYTDAQGVSLGIRWTPVDAVGLYVPGGLASYPSSVLMNAIPAKVAGVERIAMVVPTPDGQVNEAVLSAASIAGVDEIYRVGGAQAIGALAYGTESIAPVAKIVGPGNAYVA
ncbi:MAG TPA: histidinol dehydrogenase, partial [Devosia sp.]|nr:histidinol dehydrogenase [Devosia sp.]